MRSALCLAITVSVAAAVAPVTVLADRAVAVASPGYAALAGTWAGADWGTVVLNPDGTGSYTDTYQTGPGRIRLRNVGERQYVGFWGESNRRFGTLTFTLAPDGRTITGRWAPDPQSTLGTTTGGPLLWTVVEGSARRPVARAPSRGSRAVAR